MMAERRSLLPHDADSISAWLARAGSRLEPPWGRSAGEVRTQLNTAGGGTELVERCDEARGNQILAFRALRIRSDLACHAGTTPLRVAVSGASGLVGTSLCSFLKAGGHTVLPMVRRSSDEGVYWNPRSGEIDAVALEGLDAVVHLAGASIASKRWTPERKALIADSRVQGTGLVAGALAGLTNPPAVMVSASATGFYGHRTEEIDESSAVGKGFLAEVASGWEAAAESARAAGIRVVHPRIGLVVSARGGALSEMLAPFKMGVGGPVAGGKQGMCWVHLDDLVRILWLAITSDLSGPVNAVAAKPIDNAAFTRALGAALGRPAFLPAPAFALRLAFGELAQLFVEGSLVRPQVLQDAGFQWLWSDLEQAIRFELGR